MFALALFVAAQAGTVPAWRWPTAQPVRYHLETELLVPRGLRVKAAENLDARIGSMHLTVDTECTPKPVGKNVELTCTLVYVGFSGAPYQDSEAEALPKIMAEWSAGLRGVKVVLFLGGDGHLKEFDVKGQVADNLRVRQIQEAQRIYLLRAFALFDLPLATEADDWKRGWEQKGSSYLWSLVSQYGTVGAGSFNHKPLGEADGLYSMTTTGHAMVASGESIDAGGARLVDIRAVGSVQFDVAKGLMAWRDITLDGRLTVSTAESGSDAEFGQISALQLVDAFLPDGQAPIALGAARAPRIENPPPDLPPGILLVPFAELGMQPLFIPEMPDAAKAQSFPTNHVLARVIVGADGVPTAATVYKGYAILVEHCQQALKGARFTPRAAPYAVDVDVEYRAL